MKPPVTVYEKEQVSVFIYIFHVNKVYKFVHLS
jgi:hypothetical protein